MCAVLLSNAGVRWHGECQVRAAHLCRVGDAQSNSVVNSTKSSGEASQLTLRSLLSAASGSIFSCAASTVSAELHVELFFSDFIFEPGTSAVHGVFQPSESTWPIEWWQSGKGPYESTGIYGEKLNEDEERFAMVREEEFLRGVDAGWVNIDY